uniref:Channel subunit of ABC transporter for cytochrome c1 n=1 Tax=Nitella hyalina TaxID=181804 RepID=H9LTC3_NITHY|nr:channel subunit of ABC transporter for cytochrome c1 [Nitella hyalina]AEH42848.1 channel subunit of ABC transporter for cytochrome c1 [Nitella hyalina]
MILFFKLVWKEIVLNFHTVVTAFLLFLLYIAVTPLLIGFSTNLLFHFHLGLIWMCILFSFLPNMDRLFKNDFEDGTLELYCLSGPSTRLQKIFISQLLSHWLLKIMAILLSFPVLQLLYHFQYSTVNCLTIVVGSLVFTLICGIHSCLTLGLRSTDSRKTSFFFFTTLPTLLPLILFCTSYQTEGEAMTLFMGYLLLFFFCYPILVSITLRNLISQ